MGNSKHFKDFTYSNIFKKRFVGLNGMFDALLSKNDPVMQYKLTQSDKEEEIFVTESSYEGSWDDLGMFGSGIYKLPHDVIYNGHMKDGMCHGTGTLSYPMGQKFEGFWSNGILLYFRYIFTDGLEYNEPWKYCKYPDRRFYSSIKDGLRPANHEFRTNTDPARKIPDDSYDVGEGFYNRYDKCIYSAYQKQHTKMFGNVEPKHSEAVEKKMMLSIPPKAYADWIVANCRKAWDEPTGYRPDLYERWVSGKQQDAIKLRKTIYTGGGIKELLPNFGCKAMSRTESSLYQDMQFEMGSQIYITETMAEPKKISLDERDSIIESELKTLSQLKLLNLKARDRFSNYNRTTFCESN